MDFKEVFGEKQFWTVFNPNNKTVVVVTDLTVSLSCPMSFTSFPFDEQRCNLELRLPSKVTPKLHAVHLNVSDVLGYNMQACLYLIRSFSMSHVLCEGFAVGHKVTRH